MNSLTSSIDPNGSSLLDFEDISYLGAGSYAQVRKVRYKDQIAAVKIFKQHKHMPKYFLKEVNELKKLNHPNVIKLLAYGKWKDKFEELNCMIIEFADVGSLHHVLYDTQWEYTLEHGISWLCQCSDAVNYLHSMKPKPKIHRDLKPLNLLLMNGGRTLKVCDFGTACDQKTVMTLEQGSPCWIAPEMLMRSDYNEKCDVYSFGIIIWEVICRLSPYFGTNYSSTQIMYGVTRTENPLRPKQISACPAVVKLLIERCLDGEPNNRPSMGLIFELMRSLDSLINKQQPLRSIVPPEETSTPTNEPAEYDSIDHECHATSTNSTRKDSACEKTILSNNNNNNNNGKNETIIRQDSSTTANGVTTPSIIQISPSPIPLDPGLYSQISRPGPRPTNQNRTHRKSRSIGNNYDNIIVQQGWSPTNNNTNQPSSQTSQQNQLQHQFPTSASSSALRFDDPSSSSSSPALTPKQPNHSPVLANNNNNSNLLNQVKNELNNRMETMLYDPLEPIYSYNDSLNIFTEHRNLIKLDEALQKRINSLKAQSEQLKQTLKNIDTYNELLKQKNMLISGNNRLRNLLAQKN